MSDPSLCLSLSRYLALTNLAFMCHSLETDIGLCELYDSILNTLGTNIRLYSVAIE